MQKNSSAESRQNPPARHRRRRGAGSGLPEWLHGARLLIPVVAVVVLLVGAGYLVIHVTATPRQHRTAAARPAGSAAASRAAAPDAGQAAPTGQSGDYRVGALSFSFTEPRTVALAARILQVRVFFPDTGQSPTAIQTRKGVVGEFPLVVFAPGYRQCDTPYSDLLAQWASAGYVVAALDFPLTNCQTANPDESDLIHQPQDVAAVIGNLDSLSGQPHGPLAGLVDVSKVAVAGHSDGGDTVAAMAAMSCCRYPGLRAVIVLAGAEWPGFAGRWFGAPTPPMLFVQGTADTWNPPAASMQLYQADNTGPRYYLQLLGADHLVPYEGAQPPEPIVAQVTIDFLDQFLAGSGDESAAMRNAGDVPGVAQLGSAGVLP